MEQSVAPTTTSHQGDCGNTTATFWAGQREFGLSSGEERRGEASQRGDITKISITGQALWAGEAAGTSADTGRGWTVVYSTAEYSGTTVCHRGNTPLSRLSSQLLHLQPLTTPDQTTLHHHTTPHHTTPHHQHLQSLS